jgi:hypothetical protein
MGGGCTRARAGAYAASQKLMADHTRGYASCVSGPTAGFAVEAFQPSVLP